MPTRNLVSETSNSDRLSRAGGLAAGVSVLSTSLAEAPADITENRGNDVHQGERTCSPRSTNRLNFGPPASGSLGPAVADTDDNFSIEGCLSSRRRPGEFLRRGLLASCGVFLVGLGAIGVVLPGVPTVGPLLMASFFFAKSFPVLEQRLIRNRFFGPYLQFLDRPAEMPLRAKIAALVMMWTSIGVSCWILQYRPLAPIWLPPFLMALGVIGTCVIVGLGRWSRIAFKTPMSTK